jgi:hypothetical protein
MNSPALRGDLRSFDHRQFGLIFDSAEESASCALEGFQLWKDMGGRDCPL